MSVRAVGPDERPPRLKSILEAAEDGDRLEELRGMRRRIAVTLDNPNTAARDLAALTKRQIEIGNEIDALVAQAKEEAADAAEHPDAQWSKEAI